VVAVSVEARERAILDRLYETTQDNPSKDRSWEAAVRKGRANKEGNWPRERCLKDALGYASFYVTGLQMVPGTKLLTMPAVLAVTYSSMAQSAWSVSAHMGVEPTSLEEAQYDLIALTTLWCKKVEPINAFRIVLDAVKGTTEDEPLGKKVLLHLARNGALQVGKKTFGETGGVLVGTAFIETVLDPLTSELWKYFHQEAAAGMADEFVPFLGRFRSVDKARRRVTEFYRIAEDYYDAK
jgi:hypothetical protein